MVQHIADVDLDQWYETPDGADRIIPASEFSTEVLERFRSDDEQLYGTPLPWKKSVGRWALRPCELTVWAGINGHGKSLVTGHVALDLASKGQKVCLASMEMLPATTLYRMTRQALGERAPMRERISAFHGSTDGLVWLFDHRGTIQWQKMIALGRYCSAKLGIQHLFIDSLMKLGIGTDDYDGQKRAVNELCAMAHDTGLHVHLIHHARKSGGEDHPLDKFSVKGAGEIMDLADNGVLVWRNKRKERELEKIDQDRSITDQPDVMLDVCKQRDGEWEGRIGLYYHGNSMQFVEQMGPATDYMDRFTELWAA